MTGASDRKSRSSWPSCTAVAAGTGNDFKFFPHSLEIVSIDISPKMLQQAKVKAEGYKGSLQLRKADVHNLDYADRTFDSVATVFTFCSVPKPIAGLRELYRVRNLVAKSSCSSTSEAQPSDP